MKSVRLRLRGRGWENNMGKLFFNSCAIIAVLLALLTGCATGTHDQGGWFPDGPAVLKTGSPEDIRSEAIATARADIAEGKPRVAWTGGIVAQPTGIPQEYFPLLSKLKLPSVPLPSGCTHPLLQQAAIYAEAYNKEILPYILNSNNH
jgi:hypothetical protein